MRVSTHPAQALGRSAADLTCAAQRRTACPDGECLFRAETARLIQLATRLAGAGLRRLLPHASGVSDRAPVDPGVRHAFLAPRLPGAPTGRARAVGFAVASHRTRRAVRQTGPVMTPATAIGSALVH